MGCGCNKGNKIPQEVLVEPLKKVDVKPSYYGILSIIKDYLTNSIVYIDIVGMQTRKNVCEDCDRLSILRTCKECGCFIDLKVKYAESTCPKDKW